MSWLRIYDVSVPRHERRNSKEQFCIQLSRDYLPGDNNNLNEADLYSDHGGDDITAPLAIEIAYRSYSQFRRLWKELMKATKPCAGTVSRASMTSAAPLFDRGTMAHLELRWSSSCVCTCSRSFCPFSRLHSVLLDYPFPRKLVLRRSSKGTLESRRRALERFLVCIREFFNAFPPSFLQSIDNSQQCVVLRLVTEFMGVDDELRTLLIQRSPLLYEGWKADHHMRRDIARSSLRPTAVSLPEDEMEDDHPHPVAPKSERSDTTESTESWLRSTRDQQDVDIDDDDNDDVPMLEPCPEDEDLLEEADFNCYRPSTVTLYLEQQNQLVTTEFAWSISGFLEQTLMHDPESDVDSEVDDDDEQQRVEDVEPGHVPGQPARDDEAQGQESVDEQNPTHDEGQTQVQEGDEDHRQEHEHNTRDNNGSFANTVRHPSSTLPKLKIRAADVKTKLSFLEDYRDDLLVRHAHDLAHEVLPGMAVQQLPITRQWELALLLASRTGHTTAVQSMLARGTSPNGAVLWNRTTALHLASRAGYADVVMLLIEHGADPNVIDHLHLTPLLGAISNGHEEVVRMLLGAGADVNYRSPAGVSAVHTAVASRSLPILRVLIEHSAIVNTANPLSGATPLHIAAENGSFELCELLLEFGSNVHERNARGLDAFMLATLRGHMAVADLCRRHMCRGPSFPRGLDDYELSPPSRLSDLASAAAEGQHVEIIATDGHSYAIL